MNLRSSTLRTVLRDGLYACAVVCACLFALTGYAVISGARTPAVAAPTSAGSLSLNPTSGGSGVAPAIVGSGLTCPGDSIAGGYRVSSYMVPSTVNPASLSFDSGGPAPQALGAGFTQPIFDLDGTPYVNKTTGAAVPPAVAGSISSPPPPSLVLDPSIFDTTALPPGRYNFGLVCYQPAVSQSPVTYFNGQVDVIASESDAGGRTWAFVDGGGSTTTTTTIVDGSTTTTTDGSTTTTTDGSTTTTTDGSTTTTTDGSTTTTRGGAVEAASTGGTPSGAAFVTPSGVLPYTGGSPWHLVLWGVLLVAFGRAAVLLSRKPRVKADG